MGKPCMAVEGIFKPLGLQQSEAFVQADDQGDRRSEIGLVVLELLPLCREIKIEFRRLLRSLRTSMPFRLRRQRQVPGGA